MKALELLIDAVKNAIEADYSNAKAANVLIAASGKLDDLRALYIHKEEIKDREEERPPKNLLSNLIEDMNNENREPGFTIPKEDYSSMENPYVKPEKSDDDLEL